MGSNSVQVANFFRVNLQLLKLQLPLRRSNLYVSVAIISCSQVVSRKKSMIPKFSYRVFSHDVTAAILVSQDNETAAMLVSQNNPVGVELFSYANAFFCSNKFAWMLATWVKNTLFDVTMRWTFELVIYLPFYKTGFSTINFSFFFFTIPKPYSMAVRKTCRLRGEHTEERIFIFFKKCIHDLYLVLKKCL